MINKLDQRFNVFPTRQQGNAILFDVCLAFVSEIVAVYAQKVTSIKGILFNFFGKCAKQFSSLFER